MIRNLKVLGLALVAVFAMSAIAASAASAQQGKLTADGPVTLDGTEIVSAEDANELSYPGLEGVVCPGSTITGHKYNVTAHELIPNEATTATITPSFDTSTNCKTTSGLKVTVHMNGCDFVFHVGETTGGVEGTYGVTADVVCPAEGHITVTVFASASNENIKTCTVTVGPQAGLTGPHITNETGDFRVTGRFSNIAASKSGLCGSGSTTTATQDIAYTVKGTDAEEKPTEVSISE